MGRWLLGFHPLRSATWFLTPAPALLLPLPLQVQMRQGPLDTKIVLSWSGFMTLSLLQDRLLRELFATRLATSRHVRHTCGRRAGTPPTAPQKQGGECKKERGEMPTSPETIACQPET